MFDRETCLNQLKAFDLALLYTDDFLLEDEDFIFDCLVSKDIVIAVAAAQVAVDLPKTGVLRLLKQFPQLNPYVQRHALTFMISLDYVEVYVFILDLLNAASSAEDADYIILCLSKTHYTVFPLIVNRLSDPTATYKSRLKRLVKQMGPDAWAPFLCALPLIPHENFFREAWGGDIVDNMKR